MNHLSCLLHDSRQFLHRRGAQHGDARMSEVGYALEHRRRSDMAARVQYAAILVDALHVDVQLLKQQVNLAVSGERRVGRTSSSTSRISWNIHGQPNVARPTITASTP